MKILFIGDIFGKSGRQILEEKLPKLIKKLKADLVIANVENIAHGNGVRIQDLDFLKSLGVHAYTGGNHMFSFKEIIKAFDLFPICRPANYPSSTPGQGYIVYNNTLIINLMGQVFMKEGFNSPFEVVDKILEDHKGQSFDAIIVDFHAEATSEKSALFHYLNGRVTAVVGTHTHVQTADEQISKEGTAFISDVGMTGPKDSVIGTDIDNTLLRFTTAMNHRMEPSKNPSQISAVIIDIKKDGKAKSISRLLI